MEGRAGSERISCQDHPVVNVQIPDHNGSSETGMADAKLLRPEPAEHEGW